MNENPGKFQVIILNKSKKEKVQKLKIYKEEIKELNSLTLLGVKVGYLLNFYKHISKLSSKAALQLNATCRLQNYMGKEEKLL